MAGDTAFSLDKYTSEKLNLLGEMLRIAQSQIESVTQDRPEEFLRALRKRERIIRRIDNLDASFRLIFEKQEVDDSGIDEMRNIAASILALDRKCAEEAKQRMTVYKADIKSLAQSVKQLGAYAHPYNASQGIYFDTKK